MNKKELLALAYISLIAGNSSAHIFSRDFFKELDSMDRFMNDRFNNINMYKNEKTQKFTIEVALAGFEKKDIKVTIDNKSGIITITAESKIEEKEEGKNEKNIYIHKSESIEEKYFNRSFTLPSYVDYKDATKIETTYKNGMLKIEFPLGKKEKTDKITLQINEE